MRIEEVCKRCCIGWGKHEGTVQSGVGEWGVHDRTE